MDLLCWPVGGRGDAVQFVNPPNLKMHTKAQGISEPDDTPHISSLSAFGW